MISIIQRSDILDVNLSPMGSAVVVAGLSTDTPKPTDGIANGSMFVEMDTGKIYLFDADGATWREF